MQQLQEKPDKLPSWRDSNPWILHFRHNASASKFKASGSKVVNGEFFSIHKVIKMRYSVIEE